MICGKNALGPREQKTHADGLKAAFDQGGGLMQEPKEMQADDHDQRDASKPKNKE